MKDSTAVVVYNEKAGTQHARIGLKVGWDAFAPGQFVMVEAPNVFLRRPFGIVSINDGILELCLKIRGKGTQALSKMSCGDQICVLGPLGQGYVIPKDISSAILVAGGYGIASIMPLARHLVKSNVDVHLYYGAKKASDLIYNDDASSLNLELTLVTEDGSAGEKGFVTDVLERDIKGGNNTIIFSCGPHGMLKKVAGIAKANHLPAQVSLESHMACGLGVCLGCMIKMKDGSHQRACREGPVFDAGSILWE